MSGINRIHHRLPLIVFLGFSLLLTNCAEERVNSGEGAAVSEPKVFSMLYSDNATYGYSPDWLVLREMTRLTNVSLDIEAIPEADFDTKRRIVLSSGAIHDIVTKTSADEVGDYISSGMILPVSRYADRMPHFTGFIEAHDLRGELDAMTEADGEYYGLPIKCLTERVQVQVWTYRKDVLEKHGLAVPETFEQFIRVCRELKRIYPDSYPLTNRFGAGNLIGTMAPAFGTRAGWGLGDTGYTYDEKREEWIFAPTAEEYKILLQWLKRMLDEGLLDPEFTTLDSNVYEDRIVTGQTFFMADWLGNEIRYHKKGREDNPDFTVAPMMPPAGPGGERKVRSSGNALQGWVIPARVAEEEDFGDLLRFVDWFYSDEGTTLLAWGVEGITFEFDGTGRKRYREEIISGELDASKDFGFLNNSLTAVYPFDAYLALQNGASREIISRMAEEGSVPPPDPKLRFTPEERKKISRIQAGLGSYYNRMMLEFIYGEVSFDFWGEYVEQCERKGSLIIGEAVEAAWRRQNQ